MVVFLLTFMFSSFILTIFTSTLSIRTFFLLCGVNILLHTYLLCLLSYVAVKSFEFRLSNFIEGMVLVAFPKNYVQVSASQIGNEFRYAALLIEPNTIVVDMRVITFGEMLSSLQNDLPFIYSFIFSIQKRRKYSSLLHPVIPCGVYAVVSLDETTNPMYCLWQ